MEPDSNRVKEEMIMKDYLRIVVLFAVISVTLVGLEISIAVDNDDSWLLEKTYGDLRPFKRTQFCTEVMEPGKEYHLPAASKKCEISYVGIPDRENQTQPVVTVYIYFYSEDEYAKGEALLRQIYVFKKDVYQSIKKQAGTDTIKRVSDKGITHDVYWESFQKLIWISSRDVSIPDEIINDYKMKYPPTQKFTSEDMKVENIIKIELKKKFSIIYDNEIKRAGTDRSADKPSAYSAMLTQCYMEMEIRCLTGTYEPDNNIDCNITLIPDDQIRMKEWKALEEQIKTAPIVMDVVNWDLPRTGTCQNVAEYPQGRILKVLQVSEEDVRQIFSIP